MKPTVVLRGAALIFASLVAAVAVAQEHIRPIGVVELFTSQGCSSCPPADKMLAELVAGGDVVALGYHVDYWDYLGWRDTLARPENTKRQYLYGKQFGSGSVYTPQAVVNGRAHFNGADREAVTGALKKLDGEGQGMTVEISARRVGDAMVIEAGASPGGAGKANLVLVNFQGTIPVTIERGENKGTAMTYVNAVSNLQVVGMWHGAAKRYELPASAFPADGWALLLQQSKGNGVPGPILGAICARSVASR